MSALYEYLNVDLASVVCGFMHIQFSRAWGGRGEGEYIGPLRNSSSPFSLGVQSDFVDVQAERQDSPLVQVHQYSDEQLQFSLSRPIP